MPHPESGMNPIDQLAQAVHTLPPDIAAARAAISALTEQMPGFGRDEKAALAGRTAGLCGELALVTGMNEEVIAEFSGHSDRFGSIANALGGTATAQVEPTDMGGKNLTAGKRVAAAL